MPHSVPASRSTRRSPLRLAGWAIACAALLAFAAPALHALEGRADRSLFDRPDARIQIRPDDAGGPPRTMRAFNGITLPGWSASRRGAVEALFESEAARFQLRPGLDRFVVRSERERRGVHHLKTEQTYRGVPVFGAEYSVAVGAAGDLRMIAGRGMADLDVSVRPRLAADQALQRVRAELAAPVEPFASRRVVHRAAGGRDHLAWELRVENPITRRQHLVLVDAHDGAMLAVHDLSFDLAGRGNVYPVNGSDPLDFVERTLPRLLGETELTGEHTRVHDALGADAIGTAGAFLFDTTQAIALSQTNVYWHVDHFFQWLRELGYAEPMKAIAYVNGADPPGGCSVAFANPAANTLHFFPPCLSVSRNTALAADVIYHEATHLVTASYGLWATDTESRAVHEAYSDYMAAALTGDPRIAEWTMVPCDRNTQHGGAARWLDSDLRTFHYSRRDSVYACYAGMGDPHAVGMILASAFWDLRSAIGPAADQLVVDALDYLPTTPDFGCVADAVLQANYDHHDARHAIPVLRAFLDRGIRGAADVEIVGPSSLLAGESGTFTAIPCCGVTDGVHTWSMRPACDTEACEPWTEVGEGPTVTVTGTGDFDLRVAIGDRWGRTAQNHVPVRVFLGPPPAAQLSIFQPCSQQIRTLIAVVAVSGTAPLSIRWYVWRFDRRELSETTGTVLMEPCQSSVRAVEARVTDYAGREAIAFHRFYGVSEGTDWALGVRNESAGATEFIIDAPFEERVRLAIHDVAGRKIARPWDGPVEAGRTKVKWAHGAARPGLYFARLTTTTGILTRKVLVTP